MKRYENDGEKYLLPLKMRLLSPYVVFEKSYVYFFLGGLLSVLFLFSIRQGFANISSTDILICVLILLALIFAYVIVASSSYIIIDDEKIEHKNFFKTTTIYWNNIYNLSINIDENFTGMTRGIKHTSGKIIEITFDDTENNQITHCIECFNKSGISAEMLGNTIQGAYNKSH